MPESPLRVCVVGPGTRFLSGITYYTFSLSNALSEVCEVSVILLRRLLPARLYPGWKRVGRPISTLTLEPSVSRFEGLDWFWGPSLPAALRYLVRRRPSVLVLQWWTAAALHTHLVLALAARLLGARVVVEFHEVMDPGEGSLGWLNRYVRLVGPWLFRLASGYVVHSEHDRRLVAARFGLDMTRAVVIPHGPYDHFRPGKSRRDAPEGCCNLLYLGLIRPYKGVDDLIRAFESIPPAEIERYWLTVVGETWEGCTEPAELIARSPYRERITFINRYVSDEEVEALFGGADALVLPYRRASQSGTLHIALRYGLPVVVTAVGGLAEAVREYEGAVLAEAGNPDSLAAAIRTVAGLRGRRFSAPHTWPGIASQYCRFLSRLGQPNVEPTC